ncbi:NADH-quinone oxidoreductase subunit L [Nocardioides sp. Kera G14]|uniref:NADH-quinone oxidoreductase subunit L n=1 Tax=Nocardioides sp. Kera G14 TaxID=2884264 RepID=UPI001D1251AB|nr:NADH-quinone oxidoreductase subunit L [Nocardioides sp. Kera G14]UDY23911.1 NADH-quinone oxidoreductase subunit L [Nocardioides sp. Kera G14]
MENLLWLIIALPALGAALLLIGGHLTDRWGPLLATLLPAGSFGLSVALLVEALGRGDDDRTFTQHLWTWIDTGHLRIGADLAADQLTILFLLLITGVGTLIHVYSLGYMAHDDRKRRFFAYLNLFVAAMLTLVLAANYLVLFLGWEGVGLASYLLIGFWQHKVSAARAAKKAFVVNRIGDLGLAAAVALLLKWQGTIDLHALSSKTFSEHDATVLGLLLLLGACGKSAQVPLHTWLLDAMEGPTPVSALIHAATMVTAGVYLIVRSHGIFDSAPGAQTAVCVVAIVSVLWGAIIGTAKDDIKKALAGSTMSQIGYMMLGAGLGPAGYAFAIFHLLMHGFFKATMFLGAGSVMHAMDDDVDMRHYGALRAAMPVTFGTFAMGYLAIIGFPGFSGFWSKDKLIEAAFHERPLFGVLALLGAGLTGFYMTRIMLMTFVGKKRWPRKVHPHEAPPSMTIPLYVLAALSIGGGTLLAGGWITEWLTPVVGKEPENHGGMPAWLVSVLTVAVVACGVALAWRYVGQKPVPKTAPRASWPIVAARHELYGDAIADAVVTKPVGLLARGSVVADRTVVGGIFTGASLGVETFATVLRYAQSGYVRSYAAGVVGGSFLLVIAMLAVNWS